MELVDKSELIYLDELILELKQIDRVSFVIDDLSLWLCDLRDHLTELEWVAYIDEIRKHEILDILHQDPLTSRCYKKPRNYSGDAVVLDFIYGCDKGPDSSPLGRKIFEKLLSRPEAVAVRERLDILVRTIDETHSDSGGLNILSIASGHVREASRSKLLMTGRFERLVALDWDECTIAKIRQELPDPHIKAHKISVRQLVRESSELGRFDLIYSMGLYDYLHDRTATELTKTLSTMLNPKGRLFIANFLPGIPGAGYMECFMDWKLIYRSEDDLQNIAKAALKPHEAAVKVFTDSAGIIGYLDIRKSN